MEDADNDDHNDPIMSFLTGGGSSGAGGSAGGGEGANTSRAGCGVDSGPHGLLRRFALWICDGGGGPGSGGDDASAPDPSATAGGKPVLNPIDLGYYCGAPVDPPLAPPPPPHAAAAAPSQPQSKKAKKAGKAGVAVEKSVGPSGIGGDPACGVGSVELAASPSFTPRSVSVLVVKEGGPGREGSCSVAAAPVGCSFWQGQRCER